jgi:hypothetical protein
MKASHHAFLLIALLPVPKFLHPNQRIRGVLESRLIHDCLDHVLQPLKKAAEIGVMMSDPLGFLRYCYTPLAAYVVDTPESTLLAGVASKTSSVTMATYKQLDDAFQHEPRTASTTIAQLQAIESVVDPWDLDVYFPEAQKRHLNGVHRPFWRDWPLAEPSSFLTPEPLHHWHKGFWDHDTKWCISALGSDEIDFRFSVLHPHTGFRHFGEGISKLKQVTGRDQRDIQRYIIPVIAGATSKEFLIAIRSLMDFRYLSQAREIDEDRCAKILAALGEFHDYKKAIVEAGVRTGKGNKIIDHFRIPKLEFLQSVISNIRANGVAIQWSADVTEHANITLIKDPARSGNNRNYEAQICRYLDRADKCRGFDIATAVSDAQVDFKGNIGCTPETRENDEGDDEDTISPEPLEALDSTSSLLARIQPVSALSGTRVIKDYFQLAESLLRGEHPQAPLPFRTFANTSSALHLTRDPSFKQMSIDEVAQIFCLPDLHISLMEYIQHARAGSTCVQIIGGRRTAASAAARQLPFDSLEVWSSVRVQTKAYHSPNEPLPPLTVNASPPSEKLPLGKYDAVLVNTDPSMCWPKSGIKGICTKLLRYFII